MKFTGTQPMTIAEMRTKNAGVFCGVFVISAIIATIGYAAAIEAKKILTTPKP